MKKLLFALCLLILCTCGKKKSVLLPEIQNAKITEINDVSPAYIFYDETKPDSLDLNRANLIISTNWLVNVDKRLTLKQVIPAIKKLQDKKRNSSHKNESARNYYTCNDTSIKNLGFIDFTDVVYVDNKLEYDNDYKEDIYFDIVFKEEDVIWIFSTDGLEQRSNLADFEKHFLKNFSKKEMEKTIKLSFNEALTFQEYITFKSRLSKLNLENTIINTQEYIFN